MKTRCVSLAAIVLLGLGLADASAQGVLVPVTGYDPYGAAPATLSPVSAWYGPTVISGTVYGPSTSYYPGSSSPGASYAGPGYGATNCVAPSYAAPVVAYRPAATQYVQPAVAYQPLVVQASGLQPVLGYQRPYVVYSPVVSAGYSAPVYSAYSAPAYSTPVAAAAGPRVIVRPKVYVEGQPIRNLIRAITP